MSTKPTAADVRELIQAGMTPARVEAAYRSGRITELADKFREPPAVITLLCSRWGINSIRRTVA